jgi:segregation and condensation protein B
VEEVAGGFQLLSRPKFAGWLRRLSHVPPETRLSTPVLETLAVIAYRQPVLRADIEAIRGVNCGEILRQLMERDLVRISGRSQELGRPYLYSTTKRFLQLFGLPHIDKLPRVQAMRDSSDSPNPAAKSGNVDDADRPLDQTITETLLTQKEESEVTVTTRELPDDELLGDPALVPAIAIAAQARDDDEGFQEEEEEDEEVDDEDDEEEDIDDEEFDEEEFDDEFEEEEEDDDEFDEEEDDEFEDDEWEEVEDEEEEEEEEDDWDDEELDWEDEDEDDEDEDEEEEEEEEDFE